MKQLFLGKIYRTFVKPLFFRSDPEVAHNRCTDLGVMLSNYRFGKFITKLLFDYQHNSLEQEVLGVKFKNPVGLSAGFDKDAKLIGILEEVGFGFMSVGSITAKPYEGNKGARLHRLIKSEALVVYYGLKNIGVDKIIQKLNQYKELYPNDAKEENKQKEEFSNNLERSGQKESATTFPLFISIAKTNSPDTCEVDSGIADYAECFKKIVDSGVGDVYELNISCPNTFGGEPFTTPEKLNLLLKNLFLIQFTKPLFIKMPINLEWEQFEALLKVLVQFDVAGVIIGNLNKDHNSAALKEKVPEEIKGGISGKPTFELSNNLISLTYKHYGDKLIIVGTGGIFSAEDAYEKIKRGATLVQLITGMIYQGPQLIGEINSGLVKLLQKDGYNNIKDAIGVYNE